MPQFNIPVSKLSGVLHDPWPFMAAWVVGGLLTIFVPVLKWNANRQEYYDSYGYAIEYEQQQRAYEEQQNNNNNNNNYYYYNYPSCHWWQWKCRLNQFNYRNAGDGNQNNNGEYQITYPGWFVFFGGQTEEDNRWREENGENLSESTGAMKFVYAWSIVMFVSILFYGGFVFYKRRPVGPLLIMLFMFLQFAILTMVLICQGVLKTDDRDLEDSIYGWYGQIGVLIVYTGAAYLWFTFIFAVALIARAFWLRHQVSKEAAGTEAEMSDSYYAADDYHYQAPEGTMT